MRRSGPPGVTCVAVEYGVLVRTQGDGERRGPRGRHERVARAAKDPHLHADNREYAGIPRTPRGGIGWETMTTFLALSPERRAMIVFACLMLITIAVGAVGDSMVRSLGSMSSELVLREHPSLEAALRAESDLYKAQSALATLADRPSVAERRVTYAASAASTVDMINELGTVQSLLGGNLLVAGLVRETLEAQSDWSSAAQALMQAAESGADETQVAAAWRSVQLRFDVLVSRMRRLHEAGVAPIVAGSHAALTESRLDARRTIAVALALAFVVGSALIVLTIRAIMHRRTQDERETSYRDFDRRLQRAMQLVETEPEVLAIVQDAFGHVLGDERRAEIIIADTSRSGLKRAVVSANAEQWEGCSVRTPHDCPTMRRNTRMVFPSNQSFEACPYFKGRGEQPSSAACVPISVMGHTVGVLHALGPEQVLPSPDESRKLDSIALKVGDKIGLVRAFSSKDQQANTDTLTGLGNRRALIAQLPSVIESHEQFAVAYGDLDHFKRLNDEHGHEIGDRALKLFAEVLRSTLRPSDLFVRWGGEEFVIVLPNTTMHDAVRVLDRIRTRLIERVAGSTLPAFTTSFGVSDSTMAEAFDTILNRADEALLRAKQGGRNRVEYDAGHHGAEYVDAQLAESQSEPEPARTA
jgi:diguanylate cyclase (GGDEF)-like protein